MSQQEKSDAVEGEVVEEDQGAGLAVVADSGLRPIDLGQLTAWAESRQKALAVLMEVAIASTKAADWSDQNGKPYPEQGACTGIIGLVGINITPPEEQKEYFEDELGRYYVYFLRSEIVVPKFAIGPLPIIGRCSSRDQFFAWKRDAARKKVLRPQSEIDPGDIKSKAYTNLRYRAVKASVPEIAGMTWDRLKELTAGKVSRETVKQIHYGEEGEEGPQEGNCPTCHKGRLREIPRRDGTGSFWACSEGRYDSKTKKRSGCPHTQNDPPAPPAEAEGPETSAPPRGEESPAKEGAGEEKPAQEEPPADDPVAALTAEMIRCFSGKDGKTDKAAGTAWLVYLYGTDAKKAQAMQPGDVADALEKLDAVEPGALVGWKRPGDGAKS